MAFVCPHCNRQTVQLGGKKVKFTKASRCTDMVLRRGKGLVRCRGLVCGSCGRCQEPDGAHQ